MSSASLQHYFSLSADTDYNSCDVPMQQWDEAADWTYNSYTEGSLVWAKLDGYPWWPAMVEVDPDLKAFVFCFENRKYSPVSKSHSRTFT